MNIGRTIEIIENIKQIYFLTDEDTEAINFFILSYKELEKEIENNLKYTDDLEQQLAEEKEKREKAEKELSYIENQNRELLYRIDGVSEECRTLEEENEDLKDEIFYLRR